MRVHRRRLSWLLTISSAFTVVVLLAIALIAARSIAVSHRAATDAARADLAALEDAGELQGLLYQKGFASMYLLTRDERWLQRLEEGRAPLEQWLGRLTTDAQTPEAGRATAELVAEYGRYDADRDRAIALFRAGDSDGAIHALEADGDRAARLRDLATRLIRLRRDEVSAQLADADRSWRRSLQALALACFAAVFGAGAIGLLFARRISRPLYELVLRATSAGGGTHVEISADDEIGAVSEQVTRLARRIEESSNALAEQRDRLAQAEKMSMLGEIATAVAHEVLNPLAGIKTTMQLFGRSSASHEVTEIVGAVDSEIRRVERLSQRLLSFARPISPRLELVPLDDLAARVLQGARTEADAHHVQLNVHLEGVRMVNADADLLEQLLVNLTVNACQAIDSGGHVDLSVRAVENGTIIEVKDDGPGIPQEMAGRLFTPFATTRSEGHGLGLAISQNIALAHGGRIEAHGNVPHPGTTFRVWLPQRAS